MPATSHWYPWRSAALGWLATAVIVAVGLPLFLRMPLWIDVTLYDVAVRTIRDGGTHYRDVFDTNPPGFVWALTAVRVLFGESMEAARFMDFAIVCAITFLLLRLARRGGATSANVAWTAAAAAAFYLFISEFNHCQRDVWMTLPVLAAVTFRHARTRRAIDGRATDRWLFATAFLEGIVWGAAVWVKPHCLFIAVAAWAAVQGRLAGSAGPDRRSRLRRAAADLGGSLLGGLLVGAAGLGWLVATGAWGPFLEVFTTWNDSYLSRIMDEFFIRVGSTWGYFPVWSMLVFLAVPLAVLNVIEARLWAAGPRGDERVSFPSWLYAPAANEESRFARGLLAAVFLGWLAVNLLIQRHYHYVHVPITLLMFAVLAANRWAIVVPVLAFQVAVIVYLSTLSEVPGRTMWKWEDRSMVYKHVIWQYPDRDLNRFRWWPVCFDREVSGEVRNGLAFQSDFFAGIDWAGIDDVERFLRQQGVKEGDGSVMCWHDATHPLYLRMKLRPPIRFMHLSIVTETGPENLRRVREEVDQAIRSGRVRFIVSDLRRVVAEYPARKKERMHEPGVDGDLLPPVLQPVSLQAFPMNQPAVFRSGNGRGRYVVHVLKDRELVGDVGVPAGSWEE
jgi:hypothetical protein